MDQDTKSQGWEGRLAPAYGECHSSGGGKPPFPTLRFSTTLSLSVLISVSIFSFACATNQAGRTIPPEVESTIGTISDDIAAERYEKIYNEGADLWRQDATVEQSTATFKILRSKLGPVESRMLQSATEQDNSSGPLKGRAYIVTYRTKFQNGEGMETFTLVERNGQWLLARYFVNSTALK
jgi:hypothetical protein